MLGCQSALSLWPIRGQDRGHVIPAGQSRRESCLHLFGQFSTSPVLLPRLPCNYGGFGVFSGRSGPPTYTGSIHPPITLRRDKTLNCFWTVSTFYLSVRLYILSSSNTEIDSSQEQFYTMTNQNLIEMIPTDYIYTAEMKSKHPSVLRSVAWPVWPRAPVAKLSYQAQAGPSVSQIT